MWKRQTFRFKNSKKEMQIEITPPDPSEMPTKRLGERLTSPSKDLLGYDATLVPDTHSANLDLSTSISQLEKLSIGEDQGNKPSGAKIPNMIIKKPRSKYNDPYSIPDTANSKNGETLSVPLDDDAYCSDSDYEEETDLLVPPDLLVSWETGSAASDGE